MRFRNVAVLSYGGPVSVCRCPRRRADCSRCTASPIGEPVNRAERRAKNRKRKTT